MKKIFLNICKNALTVIVTAGFSVTGALYVTPDGVSENNGASVSSPIDYSTAFTRINAGDTIFLQGGTYTVPYSSSKKNTITISKSGTAEKLIYCIAFGDSSAIFNFSYPDNSKIINESVTSFGFEITGSYWYFKKITITKAGYQGAYVTGSNITFENCTFHDNWNSGLEINKGGSNVIAINCDAYRNFDGAYKNGGMADGFASKQTQGPGNRFIGCRAWENSDDGFDTYDSPEPVTFENCWAFRNGVNVWNFNGFDGNGNGFKIGGNGKLQNNTLSRCIVFGQPGKGFDQNGNTGGLTLYNCLAYGNGTNFSLAGTLSSGETHKLINNVSLSGTTLIKNAAEKSNTWNDGFTVDNSDFLSIDTSLATVKRSPDGTLPETNLFRLSSTSKLIDNGTIVGLPFNGKAPDIGSIEYGSPAVTTSSNKMFYTSATPVIKYTNNSLECRTGKPFTGECRIVSVAGKLLVRKSINNMSTFYINTSTLVSGLYIVLFTSNGTTLSIKFNR
jgi:hypothetical protein